MITYNQEFKRTLLGRSVLVMEGERYSFFRILGENETGLYGYDEECLNREIQDVRIIGCWQDDRWLYIEIN